MAGNSSSGRRGVDLWVLQRIKRLAVSGYSDTEIARAVGVEPHVVKRHRDRPLPAKWRRCPLCGGRAIIPPAAVLCVACQLITSFA